MNTIAQRTIGTIVMRLVERTRHEELPSLFHLVALSTSNPVICKIQRLDTVSKARAEILFNRSYEAESAFQLASLECPA